MLCDIVPTCVLYQFDITDGTCWLQDLTSLLVGEGEGAANGSTATTLVEKLDPPAIATLSEENSGAGGTTSSPTRTRSAQCVRRICEQFSSATTTTSSTEGTSNQEMMKDQLRRLGAKTSTDYESTCENLMTKPDDCRLSAWSELDLEVPNNRKRCSEELSVHFTGSTHAESHEENAKLRAITESGDCREFCENAVNCVAYEFRSLHPQEPEQPSVKPRHGCRIWRNSAKLGDAITSILSGPGTGTEFAPYRYTSGRCAVVDETFEDQIEYPVALQLFQFGQNLAAFESVLQEEEPRQPNVEPLFEKRCTVEERTLFVSDRGLDTVMFSIRGQKVPEDVLNKLRSGDLKPVRAEDLKDFNTVIQPLFQDNDLFAIGDPSGDQYHYIDKTKNGRLCRIVCEVVPTCTAFSKGPDYCRLLNFATVTEVRLHTVGGAPKEYHGLFDPESLAYERRKKECFNTLGPACEPDADWAGLVDRDLYQAGRCRGFDESSTLFSETVAEHERDKLKQIEKNYDRLNTFSEPDATDPSKTVRRHECSASCAPGGLIRQTRRVLREATNSGKPCSEFSLKRFVKCNADVPCPPAEQEKSPIPAPIPPAVSHGIYPAHSVIGDRGEVLREGLAIVEKFQDRFANQTESSAIVKTYIFPCAETSTTSGGVDEQTGFIPGLSTSIFGGANQLSFLTFEVYESPMVPETLQINGTSGAEDENANGVEDDDHQPQGRYPGKPRLDIRIVLEEGQCCSVIAPEKKATVEASKSEADGQEPAPGMVNPGAGLAAPPSTSPEGIMGGSAAPPGPAPWSSEINVSVGGGNSLDYASGDRLGGDVFVSGGHGLTFVEHENKRKEASLLQSVRGGSPGSEVEDDVEPTISGRKTRGIPASIRKSTDAAALPEEEKVIAVHHRKTSILKRKDARATDSEANPGKKNSYPFLRGR
ncbi:unnamed protein product [Amoebophrya sp. A120]|nr:unnamed protein product [Amoebophrya sp. A120]|eukprot:GSA120T00021240001.1